MRADMLQQQAAISEHVCPCRVVAFLKTAWIRSFSMATPQWTTVTCRHRCSPSCIFTPQCKGNGSQICLRLLVNLPCTVQVICS